MIEGWGLAAAAVVAGGTIAGAAISSSGAKTAAQDQENAAMSAEQAQMSMFNTTQADYAPQLKLGQGAANLLSSIYGVGGSGGSGSIPTADYNHFFQTPGYQFSLGQGQSAINRQAAASGGLYSSNTLAALGNYTQGAASTQYNSYINQLLQMAGLGSAAASGVGTAATSTGLGVANSLTNSGNAAANGALGSANAFSNAIGAGVNSNLLGSLTGSNNSGAAGQYAGEFGPGVSTAVTYQPDLSSVDTGLGVGG